MKLPSLSHLAEESLRAFKRFPIVLADAVAGTVVAIAIVDAEHEPTNDTLLLHRLLLTTVLGLPLLLAVALYAERQHWRRSGGIAAQVIGLLLLAGYYLSLPHNVYASPALHIIRFWLLMLAAHLLVSFAPFTGRGHSEGFWQFNKTVFLKFLTAALYSLILYAGLAIALAAVDHLFEIHVRPVRYLQLWVLISGVFNTWFFLSNVPEDLESLDCDGEYPKALKVFAQYILIPLVTVYLIILYAYVAKILLSWDWPKGWVANLVLGFSIAGIFALLLVHPIRDRKENVWLAKFSRWYYVALIPLVPLLMLAIWRRIEEYGITENRYFVLILGVWLAGIVVYFLLRRNGSIRVIPVSLCATTCLASFGPWGAFAVSERNQVSRLEALLARDGLLVEGTVHPASTPVPFEDQRNISSIIRYLHRGHTLRGIQPWFKEDLSTVDGAGEEVSSGGDTMTRNVVAKLGIGYVGEWQSQKASVYRFDAKRPGTIDIRGYETMVRSVRVGKDGRVRRVPIHGGALDIRQEATILNLHAVLAGVGEDSVAMDLSGLLRGLIDRYGHAADLGIPVDSMRSGHSGNKLIFEVALSQLLVQTRGDSLEVQSLEGDVYLAIRQ